MVKMSREMIAEELLIEQEARKIPNKMKITFELNGEILSTVECSQWSHSLTKKDFDRIDGGFIKLGTKTGWNILACYLEKVKDNKNG